MKRQPWRGVGVKWICENERIRNAPATNIERKKKNRKKEKKDNCQSISPTSGMS
jgi:hypothetical protein